MMDTQRRPYQTLILAALLHDIGKLLARPDAEAGKEHAGVAADFLHENGVQEPLEEKFEGEIDFQALQDLVRHHQAPEKEGGALPPADGLLAILRQANFYSAGEQDGKLATERLALNSIFAGRYLGRPISGPTLHYQPAPLSPEAAFPQEFDQPFTAQTYEPVRAAFREGFRYALRQAQDWPALEAWVYSLLERYGWAIPSDFSREPHDVSLFDHARTSCAIAAALYLYRQAGAAAEGPEFLLIKGDVSGVQDYLYSIANVGAGGVAKRLRARSFFITALTEVVAHCLRDELVQGAALPVAATIFSGGGQFVLLAPHLTAVTEKLNSLEQEINGWLWQEFQGDLAFVFGCETISGAELSITARETTEGSKGRTICQALAGLEARTEQAKAARLSSLLQAEGQWQPERFIWAAQNYEHGSCPSCGRLPARAWEDEPDMDKRLCTRCLDDRRLSEAIVKARYIAYWRGQRPSRQGQTLKEGYDYISFFGDGQRHVVLVDRLPDLAQFDRPPYQLDAFGYEPSTPQSLPVVRHFANYVPRFNNQAELADFCTAERGCVYDRYFNHERCGILVRPGETGSQVRPGDFPILRNFGCLSAASARLPKDTSAKSPEDRWGLQLLGVLRADVDNLRLLFSDSFEEEPVPAGGRRPVRSLSRLATLSRMIDLFFSGWVHQALATDARYRNIYTVYAGGDDLCLVGPWDVLIDFSRTLAGAFERYTCGNPNLSLSAAITVSKPKFPVATSARQAGELLKAAKNAGRNRLNLFGVITRWRDLPPYERLRPDLQVRLEKQERHTTLLLDDLWKWAELFDQELGRYRQKELRYPISPTFLHRLLHYAEMARAWEQREVIRADDMLYMARLAYDLGRNVLRRGTPEDTAKKLAGLTQLQQRELMAGMRLPLTYALYRNRERSKKDGD